MTPDFENLKIYGDEIVCCLISANRVSSFNFIYDSNESLTLSSDFKISVNEHDYTRRPQLIKNSNTELYIKFRKLALNINENYICQPYIKADSFTCLSCNHNFNSLKSLPCCSFEKNIIKINSGKIYKLSFLDYKTYSKNYSLTREEFKLLHFASIVDTMLLGDPI